MFDDKVMLEHGRKFSRRGRPVAVREVRGCVVFMVALAWMVHVYEYFRVLSRPNFRRRPPVPRWQTRLHLLFFLYFRSSAPCPPSEPAQS